MVMERDEMDFNMSYEIRNRFRDLLRATFEFVKEKLHQNYMFRYFFLRVANKSRSSPK